MKVYIQLLRLHNIILCRHFLSFHNQMQDILIFLEYLPPGNVTHPETYFAMRGH